MERLLMGLLLLMELLLLMGLSLAALLSVKICPCWDPSHRGEAGGVWRGLPVVWSLGCGREALLQGLPCGKQALS